MILQIEIKAYSWRSCTTREANTVRPGQRGWPETFSNPLFSSFSLVKSDRFGFERNVSCVRLNFTHLDLGDNEKETFLRALLFPLVLLSEESPKIKPRRHSLSRAVLLGSGGSPGAWYRTTEPLRPMRGLAAVCLHGACPSRKSKIGPTFQSSQLTYRFTRSGGFGSFQGRLQF